MQNNQTMPVNMPSLPKGGGALRGMGETLSTGGADGAASLSLPLPISAGRGVAPELSLVYRSTAGNSPFGMGWQCPLPFICRRTSQGVPYYDDRDSFQGPSGEVIQVQCDENGAPDTRITQQLQGKPLNADWQVTRYQPRIAYEFSRLEYWQPQAGSKEKPFWVMFSPDGQIHLFGKNAQARVANAEDDKQIAQWLLEESVTATGEHIYYQYRGEDDAGCDENEVSPQRNAGRERYLVQVNYGNILPQASLFALDSSPLADNQWLFHLVLDYGERTDNPTQPPEYQPDQNSHWRVRADCFSRFEYGFERRTRRLCRQILMYHRLQTLSGKIVADERPVLVSRLRLSHQQDRRVTIMTEACLMAHEHDGTPLSQPPLTLNYQLADHHALRWWPMPQLSGFNGQQPFQLVDLYGEGLPGVLFQDSPGAWWYRPPLRSNDNQITDPVTYGEATPLPQLPSQQLSGTLMDINGDGKLEWVVTRAGVSGTHSLGPDGQWSPFVPLQALPVEFFHPQAQLADLTGAGLADLAMIGPRSVRLYAAQSGGWHSAETVLQSGDIRLPVVGNDARKLVAFADLPGSGQQHLVEISSSSVCYWPNLGHGRFAPAITLSGFSIPDADFNPDRVWLADTDGSGTTDIIYANSTSLTLFINESGNRFSPPVTLPLPDGIIFERTCQLHIADTQGMGISSIILTIPHMTPMHWRLDLAEGKPWLLASVRNNMGAVSRLFYRSSVQFWLDEKHQAAVKGETQVNFLPFPVHLLWRKETEDEISGNRLTSVQSYAHGAWDGREREFRGFARVTQYDSDSRAAGSGDALPPAFPSKTVSWFATGLKDIDTRLHEEYWQGDPLAWRPFRPRFTEFAAQLQKDHEITPSAEEIYWLQRAMKGQLLHLEQYGEDGSAHALLPYFVTDHHFQVRRLQSLPASALCVWCSEVGSRTYHYERIATDPQCSQEMILAFDRWGYPTESVTIHYPRRTPPATSPWPDTLPDTLFASSYDEQQSILRLHRQRQRWLHLLNDDRFLPGLPLESRLDIGEYSSGQYAGKEITFDSLSPDGGLNYSDILPRYAGHQRVVWQESEGETAWPPRQRYTETAELDDSILTEIKTQLTADMLQKAGYLRATPPFRSETETDVLVARRGYTEYGDATNFYRPLNWQPTLLTGKNHVTWDAHYCAVLTFTDAAGLSTHAEYDYRFMVPQRITDINDNQHLATFDALGRLTSERFRGTENGQPQGYSFPDSDKQSFIPPISIADGLALRGALPVARCVVYHPSAWMAPTATRQPPHVLVLTSDRYDSDPQQQIRQSLTFSDGFGRLLQRSVRHPAGDALQRTDDGGIATDENGHPLTSFTETRWAITGRQEYDSKGQPVRRYQPYFLNSWQYLRDDSARKDLFADTHYYDPLGREYQVKTAQGWLRRCLFTPWFIVNEDENDTASEVSSSQ
ncbi:MAG: SpvB/TcaC N-terminal domain-containing protein [Rouxiella aceris]|uniref:SpvB/TcaC N-terminal domain-containing protein n=1 Tax=Rouxiella aceris TaxID=2703884 RepID=UPI002849C2F2|nr:SpvB/TcaC N-terminal domain-containing protein [Rouxiella aceris]MDR3430363.1 SpvB/TcaC N-terminal domain-containing protein [Rouxiella aceris]